MLARRLDARRMTILARALAVLILVGFVVEQTTYAARGDWSVRLNLPLNLSDVVTFVAVAALWHPRRGVLTELAWFWGLTATLQAVLTPDLGYTFPDVLYITFFVTHGGAIVAAVMLVIGLRLVPRRWAVIRVYGLTIACAAVAAAGCLDHGRQLHVPAPQAVGRLDPRPARAVAVVPARRRAARARDAARARSADARDRTHRKRAHRPALARRPLALHSRWIDPSAGVRSPGFA